ncbi:hypothetical protein [Herbaspirillum sp. NPDC101397]|uniref:hypothetical protein n=1 Tax=Herbaspirillum sp. NPDC101397 TaxID=3364006 RepID=UPI00383A17F4
MPLSNIEILIANQPLHWIRSGRALTHESAWNVNGSNRKNFFYGNFAPDQGIDHDSVLYSSCRSPSRVSTPKFLSRILAPRRSHAARSNGKRPADETGAHPFRITSTLAKTQIIAFK